MSDHDPLCRWKPGVLSFCECAAIARARADEQDTKFAQLDHAEAVAAKLVEVICDDAAVMAWDLKALEATARERDAARTERLEALQKVTALDDQLAAARAEFVQWKADLRAKVEALSGYHADMGWIVLRSDVLALLVEEAAR